MSEADAPVAWRESRRLTGPNLLLDGPGAVLEATLPAGREDELVGSLAGACPGDAGGGRLARGDDGRRAASRAAPASRSPHRSMGSTPRPWSTSGPARPRRRPAPRVADLNRRGRSATRSRPTAIPTLMALGRRRRSGRRRLHPRRPPGVGRPGRGCPGLARPRPADARGGRLGTRRVTCPSSWSPAPTASRPRSACSRPWPARPARSSGSARATGSGSATRSWTGATIPAPAAPASPCAIPGSRSRCWRSPAAASCAAGCR